MSEYLVGIDIGTTGAKTIIFDLEGGKLASAYREYPCHYPKPNWVEQDADLLVSASSVEGLPIAVLEAMVSRCPVVLSDIPPHREIADGVGFIPLVKVADTAGLSREIDRFQRMPSAERAGVGNKCRKLAVQQFSLTTMHKQYEELYKQLLTEA